MSESAPPGGRKVHADETSKPAESHGSEALNARGIGLAWSGDASGAEAAFREADDAGSSAASFNLAQLLAKQGDERGAIEAFGRAMRRGHVVAGCSLGELLAESGDIRGAIEAYGVAAERGHPLAAFELGVLHRDRGDLEAARSAFEKADALGHAWAALELGEILEHTGDRDGAIAAYWRAADRSVASARARLEALLAETGHADKPIAASRAAGGAALVGSAQRAPHDARTAPRRWHRRRLAWTGGTLLALAALLVVTLVTLLPTASPRTVANSRTAPATRGRTGGVAGHAPQNASGPTPQLRTPRFTAMQSALLTNVPDAANVQCLPRASESLPRSVASIHCLPSSTGVSAAYYRYSSRTRLRRLFHNYRAWFASRHKLRDCAGRTHGTYFQASAATVTGRWACFYNDRTIPGSACIDWADYALLIFGTACQADGNFTALATWWRQAGPVPASTHGLTNRY